VSEQLAACHSSAAMAHGAARFLVAAAAQSSWWQLLRCNGCWLSVSSCNSISCCTTVVARLRMRCLGCNQNSTMQQTPQQVDSAAL
jgi:hypothetical protein